MISFMFVCVMWYYYLSYYGRVIILFYEVSGGGLIGIVVRWFGCCFWFMVKLMLWVYGRLLWLRIGGYKFVVIM